jgi:hypothetical protein
MPQTRPPGVDFHCVPEGRLHMQCTTPVRTFPQIRASTYYVDLLHIFLGVPWAPNCALPCWRTRIWALVHKPNLFGHFVSYRAQDWLRIVAKRCYVISTWLSAIPDPMSSGGACEARPERACKSLVCDLPFAGHPTSHLTGDAGRFGSTLSPDRIAGLSRREAWDKLKQTVRTFALHLHNYSCHHRQL